ncbi:MAG: bacillithiol biosynthesis deacetylase BshB1 [Maribacter sp.]|jgi:bacillithiol biosynthesis deacetylase BshB1
MKVDILAIGVHPDDIELSCCGTILKHIEMGKKVGILDLTRGELGTRGTAETRDEEAADAAKIMGTSFRKNTKMADGFFTHTQENLLKIIEVIRFCQPEIILNNAINDRHPDHGRAAKLVSDACFLSGLIKIETKGEDGKIQDKWRPKSMYHYIQDYRLEPDFVIDITPYFEKKVETIMAYKTQFYNPESNEPETPISSKAFMDFLQGRAVGMGRPVGYQYGEGFISGRTIGVKSLFDLD